MQVQKFTLQILQANCYVVIDDMTGKGIVIDPGDDSESLTEFIQRRGIEISAILNTHGHIDHIGGNVGLKNFTGAPLMIHQLDEIYLKDSFLNGAAFFGFRFQPHTSDQMLQDGDLLQFGNLKIKVLHTPGHSPGSVCFLMNHSIFTGDFVFRQGIGRWDLPGGSKDDLFKSVQEVFCNLPDDLTVYPGHGEQTTVGFEKEHNPYIHNNHQGVDPLNLKQQKDFLQ